MDQQSAKQQVIEKLKGANHVLVTVSKNPTVDQLAACIGVTLMLNKMDKHATAVFSGHVPSTLEFLKPEDTINPTTDSLRDFIISLDKAKADKLRYKVENDVVRIFITPYRSAINESDLVFTQGDFNVEAVLALGITSREQIDNAIAAHGRILHDATVITVNPGQATTDVGQVNWNEQGASSLSEMLVSISEAFGSGLIDNQTATAFLTGIVAETDRFANSKTSPKVMTMSAQLMAAGANQQLIADKLEEADEITQPPLKIEQKPNEEADDGTLEVDHGEKKPEPKPEPTPEPKPEPTPEPKPEQQQPKEEPFKQPPKEPEPEPDDDIFIDPHGAFTQRKDRIKEEPEPQKEPSQIFDSPKFKPPTPEEIPNNAPSKRENAHPMLSPGGEPLLGGTLNAHSRHQYEEPSTDPMNQSSGEPMLEHPEEVAGEDELSQPIIDRVDNSRKVDPEDTKLNNETLSQIEAEVRGYAASPYTNRSSAEPAQEPSMPPVPELPPEPAPPEPEIALPDPSPTVTAPPILGSVPVASNPALPIPEPQLPPPVPELPSSLDSARSAVDSAISAAPFDPAASGAISALNSLPIADAIHKIETENLGLSPHELEKKQAAEAMAPQIVNPAEGDSADPFTLGVPEAPPPVPPPLNPGVLPLPSNGDTSASSGVNPPHDPHNPGGDQPLVL